ncbi:MAG TPA: DNA repair protein RadA [Firmicutes bacterium]|nr:DNA repair protein RadA [Bacillota bacterium]
MKEKTVYVCRNCGARSAKWMGVCPRCRQYNTFEEMTQTPRRQGEGYGLSQQVQRLEEVEKDRSDRLMTGIGEFDRVLGGGLVRDSVTILSSPPGGGKSTLSLAVANRVAEQGVDVLYASGEESASQIKGRADRILDHISKKLWVLATTSMDQVLKTAKEKQAALVVVDSIQTFQLEAFLPSRAGNPTQTMECAGELTRLAKNGHLPVAVILIGQMNKNDELAGLRALEHLADTVLLMDGDFDETYRSLTATKNRFGSAGEMGFFTMTEQGLQSMDNPSTFFMTKREEGQAVSGSALTVVREGSRPVIAEIESLVSRSYTPYPSRIGEAVRREQLHTLISILEERCGVDLFDQNVVIKTTGGLKLKEQGSNLAIMVSIASSFYDVPISPGDAFLADVGLTGELKAVPNTESRLKELSRMGFRRVFLAQGGAKEMMYGSLKVMPCRTITEVFTQVFGTERRKRYKKN